MFEYLTPSTSVYENRKIFHSNQREKHESSKEWFYRLFTSLDGCDYGTSADFMLIDKFVAGLSIEMFEKLPQILTIDEMHSIDSCDKIKNENYLSSSSSSPCPEKADVFENVLDDEDIEFDVSKLFQLIKFFKS